MKIKSENYDILQTPLFNILSWLISVQSFDIYSSVLDWFWSFSFRIFRNLFEMEELLVDGYLHCVMQNKTIKSYYWCW